MTMHACDLKDTSVTAFVEMESVPLGDKRQARNLQAAACPRRFIG